MADRLAKAERKRRLMQVANQLQQEELAKLPADMEELEELWKLVDRSLEPESCDHSLRLTKQAIRSLGLSEENVIPWLLSNGGHCDCEVVMNVSEAIDRIRRGRFA